MQRGRPQPRRTLPPRSSTRERSTLMAAAPCQGPSDRVRVGMRANGPLVVSAVNPRHFAIATDTGERVVYLTGSHVNNNFHYGLGFGPDCAPEPEPFDYGAYLTFLEAHGHNFIR